MGSTSSRRETLGDTSSRISSYDGLACLDGGAEDFFGSQDKYTGQLLQRQSTRRRSRLVPLALGLGDVLALGLAFAISSIWWGGSTSELTLFALFLPCWLLIAGLHGLYHGDGKRLDHRTTDELTGVLHVVTIGAWLFFMVSRSLDLSEPRVPAVATLWLLAVGLVPLSRVAARRLCRLSSAHQQNVVIVGAGEVGQLICRKLLRHPEYGANVVGIVDPLPRPRRADLPEHISVLGGLDRLPEIVQLLDVERVVVAFSTESVAELLAVLRRVRSLDVQIDLVPWLFELIGPRTSAHAAEGLPLIGLAPQRRSATARAIKRTIDVIGAVIGLIVLSPLMAYIALRVHRDSPGPVLFRQTRLGTGMREFTILKFRTMRVGTDTETHRHYIRRSMSINAVAEPNGLYKLDRRDCLTGIGQWLRRTSLDELPQLFNVLKGDMSLVGPRPCIPYEAENFAAHHLDRFLVPQGLTGLWQMTARGNSTYLEALDLDVAYARDWSIGLDLRLLLRTPLQIIHGKASTA